MLRWSSLTLIGTIIDLAEFTLRHVNSAKELRLACRKKSYLESSCRKINVSSAYWRIGKSWTWSKSIGKERSPCCLAALPIVCKKSTARTKRVKHFPKNPIKQIAEILELKIIFIQLSHLLGKPLLCIIYIITSCSTMLKAFSKSNLRIMISLLDYDKDANIQE